MRRLLIIGVLILPLFIIFVPPVYSLTEAEIAAEEDAALLDELENMLDEGMSNDELDGLDDFDIEIEERDDILEEVEDIIDEKTRPKSKVDEIDHRGLSPRVIQELDKPIDISKYVKMITVKGDCYKMGDIFGTGHFDERPVHEVCLDDFALSDTEVTQEFWEEITGFNPSKDPDPQNPVEYISYVDVGIFLQILNEKTKRVYRLPTEAEWEYAARGGGKLEEWPGTNDEDDLSELAWYDFNSGERVHHVKEKAPNLLGFYDMAGNVWEWVYDYYDMGYYKVSEKENPEGPDLSIWRSMRGGSYLDEAGKLRTTGRFGNVSSRRIANMGFRLAE